MLAKLNSFAIVGLDAEPITVEVDLSSGLPGLTIVGLPDKAVEESKERVRSAIKNSGGVFPMRRITVNLAPADLKKAGPAYDLPIAVGILTSDHQLADSPDSDVAMVGELALDGTVRSVRGILSIALTAPQKGIKKLFVPAANAYEAALNPDLEVYPVNHLIELIAHLTGQQKITPQPPTEWENQSEALALVDFAEIKGQHHAKRALEIAAAGSHNLLMTGPPGSGKTLLAKALAGILPPMTKEEALEVTKIYSVAGLLSGHQGIVSSRPIRSPHHTASAIALTGGGTSPRPGEISLAHRGVLFLDELPEFPRSVLEVLRQPLEDGVITVSRARGTISYPSQFTLIAAQNPCPCGHLGTNRCVCSPSAIVRYGRKISGPFLDRIDLVVHVGAVPYEDLQSKTSSETTAEVTARVIAARERQKARFTGKIQSNCEMNNKLIKEYCELDEESENLLKTAVSHYRLSARVYYRIIKLSRTIADLAGSERIASEHIAEAIQYRPQSSEHEVAYV